MNDPVILSFVTGDGAAERQLPQQLLPSKPLLTRLGLGSTGSFPPNLHLLTAMLLEDGRTLVRLAHLYQVRPINTMGTFCHIFDAIQV